MPDLTAKAPSPGVMTAKPAMVLPSPAPQNEAEGVQRGKDTPKFEFAPNPVHSANGASPPARLPGSGARHPINKTWTNQ